MTIDKVDSIASLLGDVRPEVEHQLKPMLQGCKGMFVRIYFPQRWVFETESGTATFTVDEDGNTCVEAGASPKKDVTVRWQYGLLAAILRTRCRASVPAGVRPTIMFHTPYGRKAFDFLRGLFGL
jgi:hypothetical protein